MEPQEHPSFKALEDFFHFLDERKPHIVNPKKVDMVVIGLFNKVLSNVKAIMLLLKNSFLEESIVLIRSIYEATLLLNYFYYAGEESITKYIDVSYAHSLRDCLYVRDAVNSIEPRGSYPINSLDSIQAIKQVQEALKNAKTFKPITLSDEILNDPDNIWKNLIQPNETLSIAKIKTLLKEKEPTVFYSLDVLHARLFFQSSECVHAGWTCLTDYHLIEGKKPLFNFPQVLNSLAYLLFLATYAPTELNLMTFTRDEANAYLLRVITVEK